MLPRATRYGITWFLFPSFCLTAFSKFFILKTYSFIIMKNHVNKEIGKHKHMVYFMQYQHTTQQMQSPEAMPSRDIKWWTQPGLAHHITSSITHHETNIWFLRTKSLSCLPKWMGAHSVLHTQRWHSEPTLAFLLQGWRWLAMFQPASDPAWRAFRPRGQTGTCGKALSSASRVPLVAPTCHQLVIFAQLWSLSRLKRSDCTKSAFQVWIFNL